MESCINDDLTEILIARLAADIVSFGKFVVGGHGEGFDFHSSPSSATPCVLVIVPVMLPVIPVIIPVSVSIPIMVSVVPVSFMIPVVISVIVPVVPLPIAVSIPVIVTVASFSAVGTVAFSCRIIFPTAFTIL